MRVLEARGGEGRNYGTSRSDGWSCDIFRTGSAWLATQQAAETVNYFRVPNGARRRAVITLVVSADQARGVPLTLPTIQSPPHLRLEVIESLIVECVFCPGPKQGQSKLSQDFPKLTGVYGTSTGYSIEKKIGKLSILTLLSRPHTPKTCSNTIGCVQLN